ncbi:alkylhydroperoxidase AhpD family core domain-containing protein [Meinhardsimonia xiamenensis]|jgi:AhpD family alkylhydroperoxidase|uniref:Alkylhydroperoxidase AhpD family core domain-containing protein n=1 Tax=Meinhardsimonia xiamenensis TaxID=990712 RepID=A0A1G9AK01_9RHOB|nr:carboxymuconolactone decarboxylase family protein [Meinhardsimonia xiamenensis]PRX35377.1 AhpD family alkylhydroperoxidase [Meinhardsimonia xiamenensis]SDK26825.1 alkylhydroperoxidase AhpD family core domain-containing protein [Meinhardsimonia xiamenensis]
MDWKAQLKNTSDNLRAFRELQPDTGHGFTALSQAAMAPGALTTKQKELIALAIGISTRCVDCIGFHIKGAARAGATREEVAETISVAVMMGGGPAYMYGVKALEAWDQLT